MGLFDDMMDDARIAKVFSVGLNLLLDLSLKMLLRLWILPRSKASLSLSKLTSLTKNHNLSH